MLAGIFVTMRVLIIDDYTDIADGLAEMLSNMGTTVGPPRVTDASWSSRTGVDAAPRESSGQGTAGARPCRR